MQTEGSKLMGLSDEELGKYWETANTLRENLDAAEYKHIVLPPASYVIPAKSSENENPALYVLKKQADI